MGNIYAARVLSGVSVAELKEKIANNDPAVMGSLTTFSSQITGSSGFWRQQSKCLISFERWIEIMSEGKDRLNVFLTFR